MSKVMSLVLAIGFLWTGAAEATSYGTICAKRAGTVEQVTTENGASQVRFIEETTRKSYLVACPDLIQPHAGHHIVVMSHINKEGDTLIWHGEIECTEDRNA